jgi:hypothetical protein
VRLQPSVEHSDHLIETMGAADRDEGLATADSAGAGKGVEGRERKLRLRERQPSLVA